MRSETLMSCPWIRLGGWLAPVEPLGVDDAFLLEIIERLIERPHLRVVGSNHELQFFDAARPQPVFRGIHDDTTISLVATIGIDGDVIDPTAMAVVSDQNRGNNAAAVTPDQYRRIWPAACEDNVGGGI